MVQRYPEPDVPNNSVKRTALRSRLLQALYGRSMKNVFGNPATQCPHCGFAIGDEHPYTWCAECGEPLSAKVLQQIPARAAQVSGTQVGSAATSASRPGAPAPPALANVLYAFAALDLLGGVIGAIVFTSSSGGFGFAGAATWLLASTFGAAVVAAAGKVLEYLNQISANTRRAAQ